LLSVTFVTFFHVQFSLLHLQERSIWFFLISNIYQITFWSEASKKKTEENLPFRRLLSSNQIVTINSTRTSCLWLKIKLLFLQYLIFSRAWNKATCEKIFLLKCDYIRICGSYMYYVYSCEMSRSCVIHETNNFILHAKDFVLSNEVS
jgi:hypothetical protein